MRGLVFVAGLSLFGCLPGGSVAAGALQDAVKENTRAVMTAFCQVQDKDVAISACSDLIKDDSLPTAEKAGVFIYRAMAYLKAHNAFDAVNDCDSAIQLKPDAFDAFRVRGQAHYAMKMDGPAIADYTKAIALNPASAEAFYGRASSYDRKADDDRAIADYTKAIELKPEYWEALNNRAISYAKKGDDDRALEGFEAALTIEPDIAGAYIGLGGIYAQKHDDARAIAEYSKAISLDPNRFEPFTGRGELYLVKHDYERAIADLTKAYAINPNNAYTTRTLRLAQQERAQALQQAQDEQTRQAILHALSGRSQQPRANPPPAANSSAAASEAQDAPPQQAPRQAEKQLGPSYNANDEIWREQQERDARENDWNYRQLQDLNDRAAEEVREADRQRQMQEDQERWNKQNGD